MHASRWPGEHKVRTRYAHAAVLLGIIVVLCLSAVVLVMDRGKSETAPPWFAGYVDVTVSPSYAFEKPEDASVKNVVLSFIVASPDDFCSPSWGTDYSMDAAASALKLDSRLATLRAEGGSAAISFGGSVNRELANACTDTAKLVDAYLSVIDRYKVTTIDFDIEGDNLTDTAAGMRRAQAVARIQQELESRGQHLSVWLTLPVLPTGLTDEGTTAVGQMLGAGVDLAGVNIMTMNYGDSRMSEHSMFVTATAAAEATHEQLLDLYRRAGMDLGTYDIWRKVGITPMVGVNDLPWEVFTLADADALRSYALQQGVGRVSMWSLNRDRSCSIGELSDSASHGCSGIDQGNQRFSEVLGRSLTGGMR